MSEAIACSRPRPRPRYETPTARRVSWTGRLPKPRSSSGATTSSRPPISMPRCPGPLAARAPRTARSRCGRSGRQRRSEERPRMPRSAGAGGDLEARRAIERAARESYGRLVAFLAARSRDVAAAEDALADAFRAALESWPRNGVPDKPEAWLLVAARRRLIDAARHARTHAAAAPTLLAAADDAPA